MTTARQISRAVSFARKALSSTFSEEELDIFIARMKQSYSRMTSLPELEHPKNRMVINIAIDALAFYRSFDESFPREQRLLKVQSFANNWMEGQFDRWIARFVYANRILHRAYRLKWFRTANKVDEPDGQKFEMIANEPNLYYGVNVTRCGIVKFLKQENAPEIAHLLCNGDYHICRFLPRGIEFRRTKVIADGATVCDFRYYYK